ncbi:hypothetical protein ACHAW6_006908 [Cyclotella cf. meneghiniana]
MPGIKLNIVRPKSKQIAPQNSARKANSPSAKLTSSSSSSEIKKNKIVLNCDFKKAMFNSSQTQGAKSCARQELDISDTDATARTDFSEFTVERGLLPDNIYKPRRSVDNETTDRPDGTELDNIKESETPPSHQGQQEHRHSSWICSTWDGGSFCSDDNDSQDDFDDSLYQLLDQGNDSSDQFRKLSLHNILVEEELSFQRSLVWNDEER